MAKNEVEIKLPLLNTEEVKLFLDQNAQFVYENHQIDTYFDSPTKNWMAKTDGDTPIDFWLRIREENGKSSLNLKDYTDTRRSDVSSCVEYESGVDDSEDVKQIICAMGFFPAVTVDKIRRAYKFDSCEIVLDSVKDLGDFIEAEYYGDEDNVYTVVKVLRSTLQEIGAETEATDSLGYPYLLLMKQRGITQVKNKEEK